MVLDVVGSNPTIHPKKIENKLLLILYFFATNFTHRRLKECNIELIYKKYNVLGGGCICAEKYFYGSLLWLFQFL